MYEPVVKTLLNCKDSNEFDAHIIALFLEELMTKNQKKIKNDGDNLYVNKHLVNKGKFFQKGDGSKGKGKTDKS